MAIVGTPGQQLYSLEVYVHGLRELQGIATGTNPCIAFRLWDFPTLFVRPDLENKEGHRRGTEAQDGSFRSICFESGKSCLFQVRPDELAPSLPLTLYVLFVDEVTDTNRTVLASHSLTVGDAEDSLKCSINRGVFSLCDVLGNRVGLMTIDVRLTCLGQSTIPPTLSSPAPPVGGRLLPGQAPYGADIGGRRQPTPTYIRDHSGRFVQVTGKASSKGVPLSAWSSSGNPDLDRLSTVVRHSEPLRKKKKKKRYRVSDDDSVTASEDSRVSEVRSRRSRKGESVRTYLRYEVLAQLEALMILVEEYVDSDLKLGRMDQYPLDEQDFFTQEIGLIKNLTHNTNKVLSAVDHFCGSKYGVSALSQRSSSVRRTRSHERMRHASPPPPPPPEEPRRKEGSKRSKEEEPRSSKSEKEMSEKERETMRMKEEEKKREDKKYDSSDERDAKRREAEKMDAEEKAKERDEKGRDRDKEDREREKDRDRDRDKEDREREKESDRDRDRDRDKEDREREKERERDRERDREREKEDRERERDRERDRDRDREREREKEREMEREREKERDRDRERDKEREMERERDREKERDREREREREKEREYEREREKEKEREREKEKEKEREKEKEMEKEREQEKAKSLEKIDYKEGERVKVRDTEREEWRAGTITSTANGKVSVKLDGQSQSFTWNYIEQDKGAPLFAVGDKVQVRDTEREDWRKGVVETITASGKPSVKIDGQQRAFTWMYCVKDEKPLLVGDRARVKDKSSEEWRRGVVTSVQGEKVSVKLDGAQHAFTWNYTERDDSTAKPSAEFQIGDRVRVRDTEREEWRRGVVQSLNGAKPVVCIDGQMRAFMWNFVEKEVNVKDEKTSKSQFSVNDAVKVRDSEKEDWKKGVVDSVNGSKVLVKTSGSRTAFAWNFVEKDELARTASSSKIFSVGKRVKVRDSVREDWRKGVVESVSNGQTLVRIDGQERAFTWNFVVLDDAKTDGFAVGNRVRVRDTEREDWRRGTVETVTDDRVTVRVDGQQKAFTWNFIEALTQEPSSSSSSFASGDRVRVRDSERKDWRKGTVESVSGGRVVVRTDGQQRGFTWNFTEKDSGVEAATASTPAGGTSYASLQVGDKVKVRDSEARPWDYGVVEKTGGKPVVKLHGQQRGFTWNFYERDDSGGGETKAKASAEFVLGDRVRVRDGPGEQWRHGTVEAFSGTKPLVKTDGGVRALGWTFVEKSPESEFKIGDRVMVRDSNTEEWKKARVENVKGPLTARVDGAARAFTWNSIKRDEEVSKVTSSSGGSTKFKAGQHVKYRDYAKDEWKRGTVDSVDASGRPLVRGDGQSRAFHWNFVEEDAGSAPKPYKPGDKVRVKDSAGEEWKMGTVQTAGNPPTVKVDGGSMSFTWNFVESMDAKFAVGDKVRVREKEWQDWRSGTVKVGGANPVVETAGGTNTFAFVEPEVKVLPVAVKVAAPAPADPGSYRVEDRVLVRDSEKDPWKKGVVVSAAGSKPTVKVDGSDRSFTWQFYKKDSEGGGSSSAAPAYKAGDRVYVKDSEAEDWMEGVVEAAFGPKPTVKLTGQSRAFTWEFIKKAMSAGDKVRVRDYNTEDWKDGIIDSIDNGKVKVRVGNQRAFPWNFVESR